MTPPTSPPRPSSTKVSATYSPVGERQPFNLLDEPWIVVLGRDGREHVVSILGLFERATEFTAVGGEVPTQGFAVTRLLLAFAHRALQGPVDSDQWQELWEQPVLPIEVFAEYGERLRHRFDLFDPVAPFFQVADLRTARGEVSGLEKIVADVPNGEPLFTTRSRRSLQRISAGEAARWLVHTHAFDPSGIKSGAVGDTTVKAGKGYPIGPGWSGQIGGVLPQGADLRETLLLNLIAFEEQRFARLGGAGDVPVWEREDLDGPVWSERPPAGTVELYTWQTRRIRLVGDRSGVTGVVLANGDRIQPQNRHPLDPHTAWRYSEPQSKKAKTVVYMPVTHAAERSVWRGLNALLPSAAGRRTANGAPQRYLAPGVLGWIGELCASEVLPGSYRPAIGVVGVEYGAQNATYAEIVEDALPVSVMLLREDDPAAGQVAVNAVTDADKAANAVWRLAENIARAAGAEPKAGAGERAQEQVYAALDAPYRRWLAALVPDSDLIVARTEWQHTVRRSVAAIARDLVTAAPPAAWTGREVDGRTMTVAAAQAGFMASVRAALPLAHNTSRTTDSEATKGVVA
ncbi:type I-E CRISPR-associated protein Cse1/CasA [Nocardia wallacei]|uniref:type I-E CRISPR-associated protein Cse1/CasA n=1 Tax=Nocardia wallacei TaxID=480035 RepID=UPI002455F339|nr:type I-E CRISPR-associated protein Cse1/CasA [Nocardia wallacei]